MMATAIGRKRPARSILLNANSSSIHVLCMPPQPVMKLLGLLEGPGVFVVRSDDGRCAVMVVNSR